MGSISVGQVACSVKKSCLNSLFMTKLHDFNLQYFNKMKNKQYVF